MLVNCHLGLPKYKHNDITGKHQVFTRSVVIEIQTIYALYIDYRDSITNAQASIGFAQLQTQ